MNVEKTQVWCNRWKPVPVELEGKQIALRKTFRVVGGDVKGASKRSSDAVGSDVAAVVYLMMWRYVLVGILVMMFESCVLTLQKEKRK